jgi:hypothetical protein
MIIAQKFVGSFLKPFRLPEKGGAAGFVMDRIKFYIEK